MAANHYDSRFVSEMIYSGVTTKIEEWSINGQKPFRITDLIIFPDGSVIEDGSDTGGFRDIRLCNRPNLS